jgi:hypothetical protein
MTIQATLFKRSHNSSRVRVQSACMDFSHEHGTITGFVRCGMVMRLLPEALRSILE